MKKEDVDKMSLQEACDYAVSKIVEQGGRCLNAIGGCVYSDGEGNHCGVGWLLDEENEVLMNRGVTAKALAQKYPTLIPNLIKENLPVMAILQSFHDRPKGYRKTCLKNLSNHIDTSKPQYQKWLEMGFEA